MDETISKLCETMHQQQQIAAIAALNIPEFGGLPDEDVSEFLKKFKTATFTLSDELRCVALRKAFVKSARVWAKTNLKGLISAGDWKNAKKAIEEIFLPADQQERYQERLANMTYDPKKTTPLSYVEGYVSCFQKAHEASSDKMIIENLVQNLPRNIKYTLNMLSDTWKQTEDLNMLYPLIKRVEQTILPYEPIEQSDTSEKLDITSMAKFLTQMRDELKKDCFEKIKNEAKTCKEEAIAAIGHIQSQRAGKEHYRWNPERNPYRANYNKQNHETNQNNRQTIYQANLQERNQNKPPPRPITQTMPMLPNRSVNYDNNRVNQETKVTNAKEAYYQRHGKPPGSCYHCQQDHFNRHCPYRNLN